MTNLESSSNHPREWMVQQVRLTAFPTKIFELKEPGWWMRLLGEPPEERKIKPKEISQVEQGDFKGGRLVLSVTAPRIDWTYSVRVSETEPVDLSKGVPSMGNINSCLSEFLPVMRVWLKDMCPGIARLAFGAVLIQSVKSHAEGYRLIQTYLPAVKMDPDNSFDFTYQINRPRASKVVGIPLRLNRLSKWNVITAQVQLLTSGRTALKDTDIYATRLELDINTDQSFLEELPSEKLPELFPELVELGKEISEKGDVP